MATWFYSVSSSPLSGLILSPSHWVARGEFLCAVFYLVWFGGSADASIYRFRGRLAPAEEYRTRRYEKVSRTRRYAIYRFRGRRRYEKVGEQVETDYVGPFSQQKEN